ncbi:MAG TPA: hypothetical protein DEQ43_24670 [Nocardioides bacterium]|jgi:hypothetical protein|nr:hypothetical protein [Nocardioides sp.]
MHPILLMDRDGDIWLMYPDEPDTLWFAPDDDKANPRWCPDSRRPEDIEKQCGPLRPIPWPR